VLAVQAEGLACTWWLSLSELMMLFLLGFWYEASIMSKEIAQVDFACKGEENKEQVCE